MNPQPRIRLACPDVGEEEVDAIRGVLSSGVLTNGPVTEALEKAFAERHHVDHAVAFANGTVALAAMYLALEIGPGDEVITPSMTFVSSATSVVHVGATPIFADIDAETFNLDPADVARRISPRTKAILAVHYGGQPANMDELREVAKECGAYVLEDAAEAHGASYKGRSVGSLGTAAMFSFTPTKNITMGEGGIVTTSDGVLAGRLRLLRNHGQTSPLRHEVLGWNWRLTEMQAAMGLVQLGKLESILARKRANAAWMGQELGALTSVHSPLARPDRDHVYMLYTLLFDHDRDRIHELLESLGIEARVYFPPVHLQPVFNRPSRTLPVTEEVAERMLSVPFHSLLSRDDLQAVSDAIHSAVNRSIELDAG
jgi:perosamine synthetase